MKVERIFISGKITGYRFYKLKFKYHARKLKRLGYHAVIPSILPLGWTHEQYMHVCKAMIDTCEIVYFLKDWQNSKGAKEEMAYAVDRGKILMGYIR